MASTQPLASPEAADYQLENVRGSQLKLAPHRLSCPIEGLADYVRDLSGPLAVDLFCGAGGLSLGLERAGFKVVLGVEQDQFAIETHRAHFPGASVRADISDESVLDELLKPLRGRRIDLLAGGRHASRSQRLPDGSDPPFRTAEAHFVTTGGNSGSRFFTLPRYCALVRY